ncbi:unnamed protein product [Eruca vesicaria subsp. sativa]|uniref:MATH domain-containing protein n=1 Tax=Eruca vesicaria subsp. sativa TaxID=29727 RepID=A0ABC8M2I6_ERUVS|nr:unnamed protein product [Eruca vesicaria subsp. sativa]
MWDQKPCFTLEISNFSNKEAVIASNVFEAGECEWYLSVHPKGVYGRCKDHLTLFLNVANRKYLRTGWQRRAKYYFLVLNESNKELYRSPIGKASSLFCAWNPSWGYRMPPSKFQEKGFLENDKLIIEVYIKVVDAFDGEGGDINGFQDFATYVASVDKIITEYVMNTLSKACNKLSELVNVGVKLDWLKLKFDEVTFKRKNAYGVDESFVQQLEERIKNLELMVSGFKKENLKSKLEKLEESVKNLDQMELVLKLDSLKSKLEEISLEKKKSHDAGESRAQKIEERVKNLELIDLGFKLACVNTKLDNAADDFKNVELMVSCLEIELDKKKDKSTAEGFFFLKNSSLRETIKSTRFSMSNMWDSFRFEIDNFSDKEEVIVSENFKADGCEWYLAIDPKGDNNDQLCLFLYVANRETLRTGWKRSAKYYFLVLNESNKELYKSPILGKENHLFCAETPAWGCRKTLPLSKFQEKGFLENDKLIIEVYIKVAEASDGEVGDINGFQALFSHVASVKKTFAEHVAKKEYKNKLSNACNKLRETAEVGVKLEWLKSKFDEVSSKRKKADGLVQQLEERIKKLEPKVSGFKKDCSKLKSKWKKSHAADECRFQKLEESVKNLELMELGLKLNSLKTQLDLVSLMSKRYHDDSESRAQLLGRRVENIEVMKTDSKLDSLKLKLEEIALESKKDYDAGASWVQQLQERIKNLELMDIGGKLDFVSTKLDYAVETRVQLKEYVMDLSSEVELKMECLDTKIDEVSSERKTSDNARCQQLEERFNNIELMMSCLKVEVDKKKDKSTAEGFLLVD